MDLQENDINRILYCLEEDKAAMAKLKQTISKGFEELEEARKTNPIYAIWFFLGFGVALMVIGLIWLIIVQYIVSQVFPNKRYSASRKIHFQTASWSLHFQGKSHPLRRNQKEVFR